MLPIVDFPEPDTPATRSNWHFFDIAASYARSVRRGKQEKQSRANACGRRLHARTTLPLRRRVAFATTSAPGLEGAHTPAAGG